MLAAAIIFGFGYKYAMQQIRPPEQPVVIRAVEAERLELQVHVAGEVTAPGVYRVALGTRVIEVVELARPLPSADLHALNLAAPLQDGQKVLVPAVQPAQFQDEGAALGGSPRSVDSRININNADRSQLEKLPGIGPALADRIIAYREKQGPFSSVDDLLHVSGIGAKRLEELRDMITVY